MIRLATGISCPHYIEKKNVVRNIGFGTEKCFDVPSATQLII